MKKSIFTKFLVAIIGLGLMVGSFFLFKNTSIFLENAISAEGEVIELVRSRSSSSSTSGSSYTYAPVVKFKTRKGVSIEFTSTTSSNPPSYSRGERVNILYVEGKPDSAKINSFFSLWGTSIIVAGLGVAFFLIGGGLIVKGIRKSRNKEYLLQRGVRINTQFQSVSENTHLTVKGRHPFNIISQWQDPTTARMHIFESDNIWFNPEKHINVETIMVYIEPKNPAKYYMDISFLPQMAEG